MDLAPKYQRALSALLVSPTHEAAAKTAGISTPTLWRYLRENDFSEAYREARRASVDLAVSQLQRASGKAVYVLLAVALDTTANPGARVSAAKAVLDFSFKAVELDDHAARIEALEQASKGSTNGK